MPFRGLDNGEVIEAGEVPSVVAISNGQGDPRRDSTFVAFLDDQGRFRNQFGFPDIRDPGTRKESPSSSAKPGACLPTLLHLSDILSTASPLPSAPSFAPRCPPPLPFLLPSHPVPPPKL